MAKIIKSAIREARDQMFLDRAVAQYLTNISANLGITRPLLGFSNDDLWRALVRRLALDYRQVANLFRDWLTEYLGPRVTATTVLAQDVAAFDEQIYVTEPARIPQQGVLVVNEGLITEQTISYSYRDPKTGLVDLTRAVQNNIVAAVSNVIGYLSVDVLTGATSLPLIDPTEFPTSGFDYTLLIDAGTDNEEVVSLTGHTPVTGPLTVSATTKDHLGPQPSFVVAELLNVQGGDVVLTLDRSDNFPPSGLVRIQEPGSGGPSEIIQYTTHDFENDQLVLKYALQNTYTTGSGGASVTLMRNGASVQLAQVQVKSVEWDLFQTVPNKIQIYIPENLVANRLQDVSFLHDSVAAPLPSTTVSVGALAGDTQVEVADASAFPTAGVILIGTERIAYDRIDRFGTTLLIGGSALTELFVQNASVLKSLVLWSESRDLILSRGLPAEETVTWTSIDEAANKVTLAAATANTHAIDATVETGNPNLLFLSRALTSPHGFGVAVNFTMDKYPGTDLEIGDPTVAPTNSYRYQGPYTYNFIGRLPEAATATTLAENLSGPLELQVDQIAGAASLEVRNADLLESTGRFNVRVGRGRGSNEAVDTFGVTLMRDVNLAGLSLSAGASIGDNTLVLQVGEGGLLPNPSGGAYSYRLLIDRGGANEEVVIVNRIVVDTVQLLFAVTKNHLATETVELMADVVALAGTLQYAQRGKITLGERLLTSGWSYREPSKRAQVEEIRTAIQVASVSGYPTTGGTIIINFGNQRVQTTSRLVTASIVGGLVLDLESSDAFPTTYPYYVEIDPDTPVSEVREISNNDTVLDQLNPSSGLDYAHPVGAEVRYSQGVVLQFDYTETDSGSNEIIFENGILIPNHLLSGLPIAVSKVSSNSRGDGMDYPFYLPLSFSERLELIATKGRAAGVEVEVISTK